MPGFSVKQFIQRETVKINLSPEMLPDGLYAFRTLAIGDVEIFLTTEQAMQIAAAITEQLASEIEAEPEEEIVTVKIPFKHGRSIDDPDFDHYEEMQIERHDREAKSNA